MEINGVLKLKGFIQDFLAWDSTINLFAVKFNKKYSVYPNILLASDDTYRKIDLFAQKKPNMLIGPDGKDILSSSETYEGINEFVTEDYTLDCCFDYELTLGNFILVFDEAPDYGGEPVLVIEEKGKVYQFKKSA